MKRSKLRKGRGQLLAVIFVLLGGMNAAAINL